MSEAVGMAPGKTDRLLQVTMGLWFGLLFIQPFEKFVAVKYLLMVGLLIAAVPLAMRADILQRLRSRNMVLGLALAVASVVYYSIGGQSLFGGQPARPAARPAVAGPAAARWLPAGA